VTNDPQFSEYAHENYIIDDDEICNNDEIGNDDAEGYFSDRSLPSDEKEEVSDEYFFDHLQDDIAEDIAEDYPVEVKGLSTSNAFDAKGNDTYVDPVRNVIGFSEDEQPKQSIYESLANNDVFDDPVRNVLAASNDNFPRQCIEISTPDVPMNLRKSPPEQMIHQSTAPKTILTVDLQQSSLSEESDTETQFDAKYEARMRALSHPLCNWQFEKCSYQIGPKCTVSSQTDAATLHTKGAQFFGQEPMDGMSTALRLLGASVGNITCTTTKRYCQVRLTMERTVFGHGPILRETMSGLRTM
jgi:hypothetical protein